MNALSILKHIRNLPEADSGHNHRVYEERKKFFVQIRKRKRAGISQRGGYLFKFSMHIHEAELTDPEICS